MTWRQHRCADHAAGVTPVRSARAVMWGYRVDAVGVKRPLQLPEVTQFPDSDLDNTAGCLVLTA